MKKSLNALFGVNINQKKNQQIDINDEIIKKNPSLNLDTWVNIESATQSLDKKSISKKDSAFANIFGVSANRPKEPEPKKEEKKIVYEEPKIPAPKNNESIEKVRKLYNIINSNGRNNKDYKDLFDSLTWEEKNYIEIIGLKSSDTIAFVFNQISNTIENIDTKFRFPTHQSYINVLPYVYFSGGKLDNKLVSQIRRLRKINNDFIIEEVGNLIEPRTHHSTIYIQSINSLIFISGSKTKTCEKFNLTNKKNESFPSLRNAREKCGTCLTNDENLYIFFGYDKNRQKFETTVEKINIQKPKVWEIILIIGDQNLLKRHSMSCIPFIFANKTGIIVTGGIGNLRTESEDTVFIDLDSKEVKKFNYLPFGSSFTNPQFLPLTFGVETSSFIYNITNENRIVSFNLQNYEFTGVE
jgi:hypothetical protein